ncbi:MAG TPA: (Fe-S)-binding protein [Chthonomonadaceae bacterium]|nr:(Fe-S)-binding protein [Chthonomonadaceae bacterium]
MTPTRTIFFHISGLSQAIFYLLALVSSTVCIWGFYRRYRLWRGGKPFPKIRDWPARLRSLFDQAVLHRRTRRRRYAGSLHVGIFFGMIALFIGTVIVGIEHYGELLTHHIWFYKGAFYLLCKVLLDLFGLGLLIGTGMALARRLMARPRNLGHTWKDDGFLALLLLATLTGFLLEGAGLAADPNRAPYLAFSPIGRWFSLPLEGITPATYAIFWWVHMPLVLGVIAALPYGRWLHLFVIPATIVLQSERPMGALESISMEEVEETGRIGLAEVTDLDRWQRMSLDGCMECGRCTDACPANAVGKELNPKQIVLDLRALLTTVEEASRKDAKARRREALQDPSPSPIHEGGGQGVGDSTDVISDASLWACTNCHACVRECPALIRHVDIIDGIRRYRVAEGRLAGTAATMLRQLSSRENPWGLPASQRLDWAKGLEIPTANAEDGREVLFWVGCAGAFEPRAQKTVRAIAELLQRAGVKFTVLGPKERCTGDPARRTGDEFLFQQLAEANVATLNGVGAKTIITQCPHCFHTMKNEYPAFGGEYTVLHHTQFLAQLVEEGRLQLPSNFAESVTYHDPCFLARVNNETAAPRKLLNGALQIPLVEVERRESKTFCCGAGGGRMWMEEDRSQRPGINRANELLATGAKTVAVGCPFCKVMVGDSIAQVGGENAPPVLDVAEVMVAALAKAEPLKVERGDI